MLQSKTVETIVGVFVALGLAALLMLSMQVSNLSQFTEANGYAVSARFQNIGGLKVRSPVKMAGVVVGRVARIYIDPVSYQAVVEMNIFPEFNKIPQDTTAEIFTAGLLGEQYISLGPGGAENFLKDGDQITITSDAVVLEQVIGQFLYSKAAGDEGKL
jgi:phospholipid/cholesterol/gamma-HCH transport system substrate-binding protein